MKHNKKKLMLNTIVVDYMVLFCLFMYKDPSHKFKGSTSYTNQIVNMRINQNIWI